MRLKTISIFSFLICHFYKHKNYEEMRPHSSQPTRFFAIAKTRKFKYIEDIF